MFAVPKGKEELFDAILEMGIQMARMNSGKWTEEERSYRSDRKWQMETANITNNMYNFYT